MFSLKKVLLKKGRSSLLILLAGSTLVMVGCNTENDLGTDISEKPDTSEKSSVSKVSDIPQVSADNYDDNVNGLITGKTLKRWIDNWTANRPASVTGKLVILQVDAAAEAGLEYIKPDGVNVFTYVSNDWIQTRSNGVIQTRSMVPDGRSMDTFLAKYDINPAEDMIVCAPAKSSTPFSVMKAGRCWYMLRYWGTAKENLAILNGDNNWISQNTLMDASYFGSTGSTPPRTGKASVKNLPEVNMVLQATLEDMMNAVPAQDVNLLGDGIFIWDARGTNEYSPHAVTVSDENFRGQAIQGHPNGALELNYNKLLNTGAEGFTWKSKTDIRAYLDGRTDTGGTGFVDGTLGGVGSGQAYQPGDVVYTYCQTTYRAMITGFATVAILGLPTRFYDGAMIEWNSLNNVVDSSASAPLPFDSPWRTDLITVSAYNIHSDPTNPLKYDAVNEPNGAIQPVSVPQIINAKASSANAIIDADLAYKGLTSMSSGSDSTDSTTTDDSSSSTGSSGGGAGDVLPANPCGG